MMVGWVTQMFCQRPMTILLDLLRVNLTLEQPYIICYCSVVGDVASLSTFPLKSTQQTTRDAIDSALQWNHCTQRFRAYTPALNQRSVNNYDRTPCITIMIIYISYIQIANN